MKLGKRDGTESRQLAKAAQVHGGRYDYSRVAYISALDPVEIVCPEHGAFFQPLHIHARGHGCNACADVLRGQKRNAAYWPKNRERVEKTLREKGLTVSVSLDDPRPIRSPVTVTCAKHGPYDTMLINLWKGQGCWKCYVERAGKKSAHAAQGAFIEKARAKHGDAFDYSQAQYDRSRHKVTIICPKHGPFEMSPNNHLKGEICPRCAKQVSAAEEEIYEFVKARCADAVRRVRKVVPPYELDVYVPSRGLAIEYNGLYWHSVKNNPDRTHLRKKQRAAAAVGIRLIHVLESEWLANKDLVLRMLAHAVGAQGERVFARKCFVSIGAPADYRDFFDANHHQGPAARIGVVYALKDADGRAVAALHLSPPKFYGDAKDRSDGVLEVVRYATACVVVGGLTRLLKAAIKHAAPERMVSYVDNRWFTGRAYKAAGFEKVSDGAPGMMVFDKEGVLRHRAAITKPKMQRALGERFDASKTQIDLAYMAGYHVLFDCGSSKYEWQRAPP